jgi:hypothetical protein
MAVQEVHKAGRPLADLELDAKRSSQGHKYLAFINCVTGREKKCRGEFNKVRER